MHPSHSITPTSQYTCFPSTSPFILFSYFLFFFFNDTATTEIYTLSLHDALPISCTPSRSTSCSSWRARPQRRCSTCDSATRSEEHTSELQSRSDLVCRLLLEKKKKTR